MEQNNEKPTPSPMRTFFRVVIIGGIIAILVFLSIGIVRIVPKVVSSLASATVSITSLFSGDTASSTATSTYPGTGFVVTNNATSTATTTKNTNSTKTNTSTGYTGNTYTNTNTTYNYPVTNGTPDLAVTIISKGVINSSNGSYVETNSFTSADTVVVKFKVENRGNKASGNFSLTVSMPASNSADQLRTISGTSIPGGAAIDAQAVFTSPRVGTNQPVTITVDPSGLVSDSNRSNNTASVGLNVLQGNNYTGYNSGNNVYNGVPDLIVQIMQVGTLNAYNQFVPTNNIPANGRVAVQFRLINQGNNANISNPFYFRAEMTDYPNQNKVYNSEIQAGLVGGQVVTYTLGFDNLRYGSNNITIYADSQNNIYETNENNNIGTVSFNVY